MKMFISFVMVTIYLNTSLILYAEEIKGKVNIPANIIEKKTSFTKRVSSSGPELRFQMYGKFKNGILNQGHINITDVSNAKRIQKIIINDNYDDWHFAWDIKRFEYNDHEVQMVDMNFDGYLDLRLLDNAGATGNNWYRSYIFDKESRKFRLHYELSELSGVKVDTRNKQIITYFGGGHCTEYMQYFRVIDNKLSLVKIEWTEINRNRDDEMDGFGCFKYSGKPRRNNLTIDPLALLYDDEYRISIRKKIRDIKERPLYGSLD